MPITKYASLENVQVLELHGSQTKVRHASLGKLADFHQYRTDDGYLYARIRAISSRVNKNYDGWPSLELAGGQDIFDRHLSSGDGFTVTADGDQDYGFSTFLGKPIFIDHHNSDPSRARGAIVDAKLHVDDHKTAALDPYYSSSEVDPEHLPGTWVELLLEVDAKSFPKFAKAIVEGSRNPNKGIDGWSMGCDVARSVCSICKNAAVSPEEYCNHIKMKGAYFDYKDPKTGHKTSKRAYENCYGVRFFEISGVFDPADATALSREVRSKTQEETITQDPKEKGLKDAADEQADEYLEDTARKKDKRKRADVVPGPPPGLGVADPIRPHDTEVENLAMEFELRGIDRESALQLAQAKIDQQYGKPAGFGEGFSVEGYPKQWTYNTPPISDLGPVHRGKASALHLADNPPPQSELSHAPERVDTLREEEICPVCGSSMDEDTCDVCGYQEPPDGFGNPDLTKAQQDDPAEPHDDVRLDAPGVDQAETPPAPEATNTPSNPALVAHVTGDMAWDVHTKSSARINKNERPLVAPDKPQSDEPKETVVSDQLKPVTSRVRTAEDFIAAAGATRRITMNHTADAASGAPAVAKPDVKTDVTGVGGVDQASNDAASKADAQIDVTGIGGTGVDSVAAEQEGVNVEQGDEHSKNIEAIHTDTWGPGEGDSLGQHDPVTRESFPASEDGVRAVSHWVVEGHEDGALETQEQQGGPTGLQDGGAVKGVKPIAEQFGDRVDVLEPVTSPANNSGPTTTWTGTEGNGVLKQQDPVTNESIALAESGLEGKPNWTSSSHIFAAFKLADLEVDLGLIPADKKYERAAELEKETPTVVAASLKYAQRVKQASARKTAGAHKLPVMGRPTEVKKEASAQDVPSEDDSFMFGSV